MSTASARLSPAVPAVLLLLRLVAGLIMAYHGLGKFQGGIPNIAGAVQSPAETSCVWLRNPHPIARSSPARLARARGDALGAR